MSRLEADRGPRVIPIPNPESTKKKVPVRLHEKIKETRDPVVGLDFIREYIAVSDPEMEPHYECDLCGNQVNCLEILKTFSFILWPFWQFLFTNTPGTRGWSRLHDRTLVVAKMTFFSGAKNIT